MISGSRVRASGIVSSLQLIRRFIMSRAWRPEACPRKYRPRARRASVHGMGEASVTGIHHVALWVADLERARAFYAGLLGGQAGALYHNERTGFRSYFVSFGPGARLELMSRPDVVAAGRALEAEGFAHVALSVGGRDEVDACVAALER